jgi:hypothetical protein
LISLAAVNILPRVPYSLFLGFTPPIGIKFGVGPDDFATLGLGQEEMERNGIKH